MVKNTEILNKLTNEHFDVAIAEPGYCTAAILHRIGAHTKIATFALPPIQIIARQFAIPTFASFNLSKIRLIIFNLPQVIEVV